MSGCTLFYRWQACQRAIASDVAEKAKCLHTPISPFHNENEPGIMGEITVLPTDGNAVK
jgi:hypothetical protein